jgi:hypothetical protein
MPHTFLGTAAAIALSTMNQEAANRIQHYVARCDQLLAQVMQAKPQYTPGQKLGNELVSSFAGEMAKELLGIREAGRYGKKFAGDYLKSEQKKREQEHRAILEGQFTTLLNDVQGFLQNLSIIKPQLTPSGNSHELVKKLGGVYRANRLETKISRLRAILATMSALPLIYSSEIPRLLQDKSQGTKRAAHDTLRNLEAGLRQLIEKELSATNSSSWWRQRIPDDVRTKAEDRKSAQDRLWPWYDAASTSIMSFVDFNDYAKIIDKSDNWREVFAKVFVDKPLILAKLRELDPIRKAIAHNRDLAAREKARLELLTEDILLAINRYYGKG